MYVVFVPKSEDGQAKYYENLGNAWKPVAWFTDEHRALDYAEYLATINEFAKVVLMPEDYVTGSGYVGDVLL